MTSEAVHIVERPDDLRGLQAVVDQLRGVTCWRTRYRHGDELVLDLGAPRPYRHPLLSGRERGTWVLGTRASAWDFAHGVLPGLEGARVSGAEVGFASLELTLRFDNGTVLRVAPEPGEREVAGWELFTAAGMYLQVGPGRRWLYAPADQPVE